MSKKDWPHLLILFSSSSKMLRYVWISISRESFTSTNCSYFCFPESSHPCLVQYLVDLKTHLLLSLSKGDVSLHPWSSSDKRSWVERRNIGLEHLCLEGLALLLQLSLQVFQHLFQGHLLILQPIHCNISLYPNAQVF